jgi:hypothetical protein
MLQNPVIAFECDFDPIAASLSLGGKVDELILAWRLAERAGYWRNRGSFRT